MQSVSTFLDIAKFADFWWKNADLSITVSNFIIAGYMWQILERGASCTPPPFPLHPWTAPKKPILNGVKDVIHILKLLLVRMIAYQICYLICIAVSSCLTFGIGGSRILAASKTSSSWQKSMAGSYLLLFWRVPSYLYVAGVLDPPLKSR